MASTSICPVRSLVESGDDNDGSGARGAPKQSWMTSSPGQAPLPMI